jgi:hypothetical protein
MGRDKALPCLYNDSEANDLFNDVKLMTFSITAKQMTRSKPMMQIPLVCND